MDSERRIVIAPDVAWVQKGTEVLVLGPNLDVPLALQSTAAILFGEVAEGRDPWRAAAARWPGEDTAEHVSQFVEGLVDVGILQSGSPVVETEAPYRVLFVCTANICRSAYARAKASAMQLEGVEFVSAGTHALVGHPMEALIAAEGMRLGIPTGHVAQQLTADLVQSADLVLAMADSHRRFILEEWPEAARKTQLLGLAGRVLAKEQCARDEIVGKLWSRRQPRKEDEVPDPYGHGQEAAADCVAQIDQLLAQLEGALRANQ